MNQMSRKQLTAPKQNNKYQAEIPNKAQRPKTLSSEKAQRPNKTLNSTKMPSVQTNSLHSEKQFNVQKQKQT